MISQICLDLDGVLCDWMTPAIRLCGLDPEPIMAEWPPGEYDLAKVLGLTTDQLWRRIDKGSFRFWADLPPFPWMQELLELCRSIAPTIVLTAPSLSPDSVWGKMVWLQKHLGVGERNYLIGPPKHFCARPGAVLIDDSDRNCDAFRKYGGRAILFPQVWNSNHPLADRRVEAVREEIFE